MLDPRPQLANNHVDQFDPSRCTNDNYGTWGPWNFGPRGSKTAQNYEYYRNNSWGTDDDGDEGVQFRPLYEQDDQYSGVHSTPSSHVSYYRSLSPGSRTQAIVRGQRELMEMVKNMPESSYELSLKDLVEQPKVENSQEEFLLPEKITCEDDDQLPKVVANNMKRQESKKNIEKKLNMITRSTSMENGGLFLKMVFPISLKSKKTKKLNNSTCPKVSPKPEVSERTSKSVDKDWWKKRFSASSESSDSSGRRLSSNNNNNGSSGSSGSSNSCRSSIRKNNGFFSSCLPCFQFTKGETAE